MHNYPYRLGSVQKVAVTAASAAISNAFADQTKVARVATTTACYVAQGANPTAVTTNTLMPANAIDYFVVAPGEKLAFIRDTADGIATVTEMTR